VRPHRGGREVVGWPGAAGRDHRVGVPEEAGECLLDAESSVRSAIPVSRPTRWRWPAIPGRVRVIARP